MATTIIVKPKEIIAGFQKRVERKGEFLLSYIIWPNSSERDSWLKWIDKSVPTSRRDNTPKSGFTIANIKGRYNSNSYYQPTRKVVRITTPEGWELEIDIKNLVELIQTCTIINGEIQDKCFWIWKNDKKWLLSESNTDKKYKKIIEI